VHATSESDLITCIWITKLEGLSWFAIMCCLRLIICLLIYMLKLVFSSLPFSFLCYVFLWCFPFCNDHQYWYEHMWRPLVITMMMEMLLFSLGMLDLAHS